MTRQVDWACWAWAKLMRGGSDHDLAREREHTGEEKEERGEMDHQSGKKISVRTVKGYSNNAGVRRVELT